MFGKKHKHVDSLVQSAYPFSKVMEWNLEQKREAIREIDDDGFQYLGILEYDKVQETGTKRIFLREHT